MGIFISGPGFGSRLSVLPARRFIVVGSIASGGLAMPLHGSLSHGFLGLLSNVILRLLKTWGEGLFICTIDLAFLPEAGWDRWSMKVLEK
jgi:hypothetical protein